MRAQLTWNDLRGEPRAAGLLVNTGGLLELRPGLPSRVPAPGHADEAGERLALSSSVLPSDRCPGDSSDAGARDRPSKLTILLYAVPAIVVALALGFVVLRPLQVLPRLGPAPTFGLIDQLGRPVTEADLVGSIVVFDFIAVHGDETAVAMTDSMRRLRDLLRREGWLGEGVRLVTISFDPEHDTPEVLRAYAAEQQAAPQEWLFLTGDGNSIREVVGGGFGVYYRRVSTPTGDTFSHISKFIVVDESGLIRGKYSGPTVETAQVMRDIGLLRREASAQGISRYAYEAAHLFLCYPP